MIRLLKISLNKYIAIHNNLCVVSILFIGLGLPGFLLVPENAFDVNFS